MGKNSRLRTLRKQFKESGKCTPENAHALMDKTFTPNRSPERSGKTIPNNPDADPDIYQAVKYFIKDIR